MRRLAAITVPALAIACAVPAAAAPVSTGRIASVRFQLQTSAQERFDLELSAITSDAGDRVEVSLQRCEGTSCAPPSYFAGVLPGAAIRIDPKTAVATFRGTVGGVRLALEWSPVPPGTIAIQDTHGGGTDGDLAFTIARTDPAAAKVVVDGKGCRGSGGVGDEVRIETADGSSGDALPLRRLTLPSVTPVCKG